MLTKSILKIWLLLVNFEKFTSINLWTDQSQRSNLDCDLSVHKFIEINFSKLTDDNQIFRNDFHCIHYHLYKISSQIIECKIFAPNDFLEITVYNYILDGVTQAHVPSV